MRLFFKKYKHQYNFKEEVRKLFKSLSFRTRDIIIRRNALEGFKKDTLEMIGRDYNITRERVRQLETRGYIIINKMLKKNKYLESFFVEVLDSSYGVKREDFFLELLGKKEDEKYILFILLFFGRFIKIEESPNFFAFWVENKEKKIEVKEIIEQVEIYLKQEEIPLSSFILSKKFCIKKERLEIYLEISKNIIKTIDEEYRLINYKTSECFIPDNHIKEEIVDIILVCFDSVDIPIGRSFLSKILKGSNDKNIIEAGEHFNKYFGVLSNLYKKEILKHIDDIIKDEFLEIYPSRYFGRPLLRLTKQGKEKLLESKKSLTNNFTMQNVSIGDNEFNEKIKRIKEESPNAYSSWSKEEEQELKKMYFVEKKTIEELSVIFKRQKGGIISRLKKIDKKKYSQQKIES